MESDVVAVWLDSLVLKLRHPLTKIRSRALHTLLFKLRERLVRWQELEPLQSSLIPSLLACLVPSLELDTLHVLELLVQSRSEVFLAGLQHFGAAQKLQQAANKNPELQTSYEKVNIQLLQTWRLSGRPLILVSVEDENRELVGNSQEEEEAEVEQFSANRVLTDRRRAPRVDLLEARGWRFAQVTLTSLDDQYLFEFEVKLQLRTETRDIVAACAKFRNELLRDFPAEVFLQRPAVLQYLLHLVQQPILPESPGTMSGESGHGDALMERAMEVSLGVNYFDEMLNKSFSNKRGNLSGAVVMASLKAVESLLYALKLSRRTCLDPTYVVYAPNVHVELFDSRCDPADTSVQELDKLRLERILDILSGICRPVSLEQAGNTMVDNELELTHSMTWKLVELVLQLLRLYPSSQYIVEEALKNDTSGGDCPKPDRSGGIIIPRLLWEAVKLYAFDDMDTEIIADATLQAIWSALTSDTENDNGRLTETRQDAGDQRNNAAFWTILRAAMNQLAGFSSDKLALLIPVVPMLQHFAYIDPSENFSREQRSTQPQLAEVLNRVETIVPDHTRHLLMCRCLLHESSYIRKAAASGILRLLSRVNPPCVDWISKHKEIHDDPFGGTFAYDSKDVNLEATLMETPLSLSRASEYQPSENELSSHLSKLSHLHKVISGSSSGFESMKEAALKELVMFIENASVEMFSLFEELDKFSDIMELLRAIFEKEAGRNDSSMTLQALLLFRTLLLRSRLLRSAMRRNCGTMELLMPLIFHSSASIRAQMYYILLLLTCSAENFIPTGAPVESLNTDEPTSSEDARIPEMLKSTFGLYSSRWTRCFIVTCSLKQQLQASSELLAKQTDSSWLQEVKKSITNSDGDEAKRDGEFDSLLGAEYTLIAQKLRDAPSHGKCLNAIYHVMTICTAWRFARARFVEEWEGDFQRYFAVSPKNERDEVIVAADTDIISTICTKYSAVYATEPVLHGLMLEVLLRFARGMDENVGPRLSEASREKICKRLLEMLSPLLTVVCRHRVPGSFLERDVFAVGSQCMVAILTTLPRESLLASDSPLEHTDSSILLDGGWASRFLFDHVAPIRELGFRVIEHAAASNPSSRKALRSLSGALKGNKLLARTASAFARLVRVLYIQKDGLASHFGNMQEELEAAEEEYDVYPLLIQAICRDGGFDQISFFLMHTTLQYQLMELMRDIHASFDDTLSVATRRRHYQVLDLSAGTLSILLVQAFDQHNEYDSEQFGAPTTPGFGADFVDTVAKLLVPEHPIDFRVSFSRIVPAMSLLIPGSLMSSDASVVNALCSVVFDLYQEVAEFRPLDASTTTSDLQGRVFPLASIRRVSCALQVLLDTSPSIKPLVHVKRGVPFALASIKESFTAIRIAGGFGGKRARSSNPSTSTQDTYVLDLCGRIQTHMEVVSSMIGGDKESQQLAKNEGLLNVIMSNWNVMKTAHVRGSQLMLRALHLLANYIYGNDSARSSMLISPAPGSGRASGGDYAQTLLSLLFNLASTRGDVTSPHSRVTNDSTEADIALSNAACQVLKAALLHPECVQASVKSGSISRLVDSLQDRLKQARQTNKTNHLENSNLAQMLGVLSSIASTEEGARVLYSSLATVLCLVLTM
ncbi:Armadillo-type fold [Phytophthora cactorum]|nr:Armadillo-type fold [Phytophthora cactorum]